MLRTAALSLTASIALAGSVSAADIPISVPAAVPAAVVSSWTGFYIGLNVGGAFADGTTFLRETPGAFGAATEAQVLDRSQTFNWDQNFLTVGGQLGYNIDFGAFVAGVEFDLSWADGQQGFGITRALVAPGLAGTITLTATHDLTWWGTLRGRLGFKATPDLLIYGTGGLAFGRVESSHLVTFSLAGDRYGASSSDTRFGYAVGAGLEWRIAPNWTVRGEYLYVDLGDFTYIGANIPPPAFPAASYTSTVDTQFHVVRVGINYLFAPPPPAVVEARF